MIVCALDCPLLKCAVVKLLPVLCWLLFPSSAKLAWLGANEGTMLLFWCHTTRQQNLAKSEAAVRTLSQQAAWTPYRFCRPACCYAYDTSFACRLTQPSSAGPAAAVQVLSIQLACLNRLTGWGIFAGCRKEAVSHPRVHAAAIWHGQRGHSRATFSPGGQQHADRVSVQCPLGAWAPTVKPLAMPPAGHPLHAALPCVCSTCAASCMHTVWSSAAACQTDTWVSS